MNSPTVADVDRIASIADPVARNHEITACYHDLSRATAERLGQVSNWCTFATWASAQAGCTIRGEDLERAVERRLHNSAVLQDLARDQAERLRQILREQAPLRRASAAVARGNLKVFAEIGREFAQFMQNQPLAQFLEHLRPGHPPEGQQLLRDAFAAYARAADSQDPRKRAQLIFYANLLVGFHEQTRLQPEIREALDVARNDLESLRPLLLQTLLPGWWQRARHVLARMLGRKMPMDILIDRLLEEVCSEVREITTSQLMTLQLPLGIIRLGRDLPATYPATLSEITEPELAAMIQRIADGYAKRRAHERDWSDFDYRMHFIGEMFRCYQERTELLQAPSPA